MCNPLANWEVENSRGGQSSCAVASRGPEREHSLETARRSDYRRDAIVEGRMTDQPQEQLVEALAGVDRDARETAAELFPLLYRELHRLAERQLRRSGGAGTLGATTLLHEAYLDLSGRAEPFLDRAHFFAYAARAMRALMIDYVRQRRAIKRGGQFHLTSLSTENSEVAAPVQDLGVLNDALLELAQVEPALAELVDLKFFCGFSFEEIARMRGVSRRTLYRDWDRARMFLRGVLKDD
jgi:RNA polymerase sigma factor (TIGR02999 family)